MPINDKSIHRLGELRCPGCEARLNRHGEAGGPPGAPRPGDVTACVYCTLLLVFTDDMALRAATREDLVDMDLRELHAMVQAMRALKAGGAHRNRRKH